MTEKKCKRIDVGKDFARLPFGRHPADGSNSGERFRKDMLIPALEDSECVEIDFDATMGVGPSFLDESFGVLIKERKLTPREFKTMFRIVSKKDPDIFEIIEQVIIDHTDLRIRA